MSVTAEEVPEAGEVPLEPFHVVCDQMSDDPVMWVGICVNDNKAIERYMEEHNVLDPYLLVVASQNGREYTRAIAPLTDGVVHLAFRRAGEFKIHVTIVHEAKNEAKRIKQVLTGKDSYGLYLTNVLDQYELFEVFVGEERGRGHNFITVNHHPHVAEQTVAIADENFAPEPAEWRKKLVGLFFDSRGRDECNWRRRWLGSLALCVLWLPLQYLMKLIGLAAYGIAGFVYGLDMSYMLKPGRHGTVIDMFGNVDKHTWLWFKRVESSYGTRGYEPRSFIWIAFTVAVMAWSLLTVLIHILSVDEEGITTISWSRAAWVAGLVIGGSLLTVYVSAFLAWSCLIVRDKLSTAEHRAKRDAKRAAREKARLQKLEQKNVAGQLKTLSCQASGQPMTVDRLLARRSTAPKVVYNRVKDRVCKPIQQK